jgi:hypothetical protein
MQPAHKNAISIPTDTKMYLVVETKYKCQNLKEIVHVLILITLYLDGDTMSA